MYYLNFTNYLLTNFLYVGIADMEIKNVYLVWWIYEFFKMFIF